MREDSRFWRLLRPAPWDFVRVRNCPFIRLVAFTWQSGSPKSSVDDLCTGQGVVLGRAATTLRSIETQPFDWMICLVSLTSYPRFLRALQSFIIIMLKRNSLAVKREEGRKDGTRCTAENEERRSFFSISGRTETRSHLKHKKKGKKFYQPKIKIMKIKTLKDIYS